jgi:hypothetical protein
VKENKMKYANHYGWTDVNPYEVIKAVSDRTLEIREMDADKDESVSLEFVAGGFSAICTNPNDQKWHIKPNESNPVIRIRLGKNGWKDKHGRKFGLSDHPRKYYDYNF